MSGGVFLATLPVDGALADEMKDTPAAVDRLLQDLRVSDCNEQFASSYGFPSPEQCIGTPLRDFFPSVERARSYLEKILAEGRVVQTVRRPGEAPVLMVSHRIHPGRGILGIQGVNITPTDRDGHDGSTSLDLPMGVGADEPGAQLLQAIERSGECTVLADLAGTIIYANSAKAKLMGLSRAELAGTILTSFWVPGQEALEREMEFATLKDGVWSGQLLRRRFDGELVLVQMRTSLISDSQGHPIAQLRTFHDVSAQTDLEARLGSESESLKGLVAQHAVGAANSGEDYNRLYEQSPVASIVTRGDGAILEANPAACSLLKYTRQQLRGMRLAELSRNGEQCREYVARLRAGRKLAEEEIQYRTGDDSTVTVEQSGVATGPGQVRTVLVHFLRDVTQARKLAEEAENARLQVARADRLASIGQLVAGVAHELNNPLTGVLTFAHMLRRDVPEDSRSAADIDTIIEAATRCREIVRGLLDFSRQSAPCKRPCDLRQALDEALNLVRNQALLKSVHTVMEMDAHLPPVFVDSHQIGQVAVNLLCNAMDAMGNGGELSIRTRQGEDQGAGYVEFEIEDTGCGMSPDTLERVFEPFFTTKPTGEGTGRGLAVAYGIIEQHGGEISVTSKVGHGTKVTVRLPAASEGPTDEDETAHPGG